MGPDALSAFMDTRDAVADYEQRKINDYIIPEARADITEEQPPIGGVVSQAQFRQFGTIEADARQAYIEAERARRLPQAVAIPGEYGDATIFPVTYLAAGNILALVRPSGVRIYLLVQNQLPNLPANNIVINFGTPAAVGTGIIIPPGGNWLLDSRVPQNDLHIYSPAVGVVSVAYINTDISAPAQSQS